MDQLGLPVWTTLDTAKIYGVLPGTVRNCVVADQFVGVE